VGPFAMRGLDLAAVLARAAPQAWAALPAAGRLQVRGGHAVNPCKWELFHFGEAAQVVGSGARADCHLMLAVGIRATDR
jgi:hypothetical protein